MEKEFGIEAKLIAGSGGVFDVFVDGILVYSRSKTGRFPNPGELVEKLRTPC